MTDAELKAIREQIGTAQSLWKSGIDGGADDGFAIARTLLAEVDSLRPKAEAWERYERATADYERCDPNYDALEGCSLCPFNQQFHVDGHVFGHEFKGAEQGELTDPDRETLARMEALERTFTMMAPCSCEDVAQGPIQPGMMVTTCPKCGGARWTAAKPGGGE